MEVGLIRKRRSAICTWLGTTVPVVSNWPRCIKLIQGREFRSELERLSAMVVASSKQASSSTYAEYIMTGGRSSFVSSLNYIYQIGQEKLRVQELKEIKKKEEDRRFRQYKREIVRALGGSKPTNERLESLWLAGTSVSDAVDKIRHNMSNTPQND